MEQGKLDFDVTAQVVGSLSTRAQATLMYKIVGQLGPGMLRTVVRYCLRRLDSINYQLPDEHPRKEQYLLRRYGNIPLRDEHGIRTVKEGGFTFRIKEHRW